MYYTFLLEKGEPSIILYPIRLEKGEPHGHEHSLLTKKIKVLRHLNYLKKKCLSYVF